MKTSGPNIILLTVDCLRFDHLGCYGYNRATSPNMDNLASRGAMFAQAISNGGNTSNSFPAILASALPPLSVTEHKTIMCRSITLAETLKNSGYYTAAFHSNPNLIHAYSYSRGFDIFEDNLGGYVNVRREQNKLVRQLGPLLAKAGKPLINFLAKLWRLRNAPFLLARGKVILGAAELTNLAITKLTVGSDRLFLWLHYMDVHPPYMPPAKYLKQFCDFPFGRRRMVALHLKMLSRPGEISPNERDTLVNLYDANIRYVDDAIGRLLDSLGRRMDNTIVVITADHGDEFGEHGKFSHFTLYDGLLHVPLIIAGPNIKPGTVVNQQVSLVDLAPTLTALAGIEKVPGFAGENLLPLINGGAKKTENTISTLAHPRGTMISYRIPGWKYIRTDNLDGSLLEEIYDLTDDQEETRNLHGMNTAGVKRFEAEATKKLAEFKQRKAKQFTDNEKIRIRAKLNKLGKL